MRRAVSLFACILLIGGFLLFTKDSEAVSIAELQAQMSERNARLKDIEKEIAEYEAALREVGAERSTLEATINALELERKKINADIAYTQDQIAYTDLEIDKLTLEITDAERVIADSKAAVGEILRDIYETDKNSLIEVFLSYENLTDFWRRIEDLNTVRNSMRDKIVELTEMNKKLTKKKFDETLKKGDLVSLREQYSGQQAILNANKKEKNKLLATTKSEEATYQTLLQQKISAKETLLAEVENIESQIQFILDPNKIPSPGTAVFRWPLSNNIITQRFGYTRFALQSGIYKDNRHNGMDLGTPTGSKLYAPLSGTVRAVGDTDTVPGCVSWGKWILVDHPNGLSSMFAHLSYIGVTKGQSVSTGEVIGFTGNTGYSTGPHLHFTLYVSEAVQVKQFSQFKAVTSCGSALSPFSSIEGYLDPLDYLPPL